MRVRSLLSCVLLACASIPAGAATGKPFPIEAFTEQQQFSQPRLSPDGKHLAINVRHKRGDRTVPTMTVYTLPDLKVVSTIILPGYEIPVYFRWTSNRRLVVKKGLELSLREAPVSTGEIVAVNLDGTKPEYLYGYDAFKQSSRGDRYGDDYGYANVVHVPRARDGRVLVASQLWDGKRSMLYEINSNNAVRKLLADIPVKNLGFVVHDDGRPRFAQGHDENSQPVLYRRDDASGEWLRVDRKQLGVEFWPFSFTADDKSFYVYYSDNGGPTSILKEDLGSGARSIIAADPAGSIDTIEYTSYPEVPFAVATSFGIPKAKYLDENAPDAVLHKTLSGLFPDGYVHFINFTDDGQKLLFSVRSDRDPGSYYVYDKQTGKADLLMTNMPQIEPDEMAERKAIVYISRDGLQIGGYLTLPKNPGKKKLPLVVLPHGGPFEVTDDWFFDVDAQFLASRGYAVLQPNYRGSGNRGVKFRNDGYRQWGGKLIDDIADGVKWAATQPEIDGTRVCAYGWSYGAYAAMMLAAREPTLLKCSVGAGGVYYLPRMYGEEDVKGEKRATSYLIKSMGQDQAFLESISPSKLAGQIKVPVLLVHGSKDKTAPIAHAELMRDALIKAGRPPEWMEVAKEGHGFYDSENQKQFYLKLEAFLAKHIGQ